MPGSRAAELFVGMMIVVIVSLGFSFRSLNKENKKWQEAAEPIFEKAKYNYAKTPEGLKELISDAEKRSATELREAGNHIKVHLGEGKITETFPDDEIGPQWYNCEYLYGSRVLHIEGLSEYGLKVGQKVRVYAFDYEHRMSDNRTHWLEPIKIPKQ